MRSLTEVSQKDFEATLLPGDVRMLQIAQIVLAMGIVVFAVVVVVLPTTRAPQAGEPDFQMAQVLSLVTAILTVTSWALAAFIPGVFLSPRRLEKAVDRPFCGRDGQPIDSPAGKCVALIRSVWVMRLTVLEAPALLGLITCLLAASNGAINAQPIYALNGTPAALFLVFAAATFPTRQRLIDVFRVRFTEANVFNVTSERP
jgi:hypothetical protein